MFAPTGKLPTFFDEFAAKGQPVDREVFTKNAVPLDENGEPDLRAVQQMQQAASSEVPPAPPADAAQH